jgi:hypothetical protein
VAAQSAVSGPLQTLDQCNFAAMAYSPNLVERLTTRSLPKTRPAAAE